MHAIPFFVFVTAHYVLCFSRHFFVLCGNFVSKALEFMSAVRRLVEFDRVKLKPATKEGKSLGVEDEKKKEEEA